MGKEMPPVLVSPSPALPKRAPPESKNSPFSPRLSLPPRSAPRPAPRALPIVLDPRHNRHLHVDLRDPAAPLVEIHRADKPTVTAPYPTDSIPTDSKQGNGGAGGTRRRRSGSAPSTIFVAHGATRSSTPRCRFDPGAAVVEAQGDEPPPEPLDAPPPSTSTAGAPPSLLLLLHHREGLDCSSTPGSASKQLQRMARLHVSK